MNVLNIIMWWIHFLNILIDWKIFIFDILSRICKFIDLFFIESYMFCKQTVVMKFNNILWDFLRFSYCVYTVHALFFNNLLWNSRKVNSFQYCWTKTIVYRVICDEMFVANFLFMLACLNFVKMFCNDIIFCNFWLYAHVKIWRNAVRCLIFLVCFNLNEMFWQLICFSFSICCITKKIWSFDELSLSTIYIFQFLISVDMFRFWIVLACHVKVCLNHVQILTRRRNWQYVSQFTIVFLHVNIVFDVRWIISFLNRLLYVLKCVSHWNVRSNTCRIDDLSRKIVLHERRFFYKIWFDLQYFRIDFMMRFTYIKNSIKSLFRTNDVFFIKFDETYKQLSCHNIFLSSCQCERDISKIINFCFIWIAHEICDNERIQTLKIVVIVYFISNFWICFCSIISWIRFENSRIINIIILYSSTITFDAQSRTKTKSFAKLIFRC